MTARRPFFSIVVPTHLRPVLLKRSLQSLRQQTFQDFEIIVVADSWDRESATVVTDLLGPDDSFTKRQGDPGPAMSRNLGMQLARGEWLLFLDDDDRFLPHHLEAVHDQAQLQGSAVLFTDCEVVTEDRNKRGIPPISREQHSLVTRDVDALWVKNFIPIHALAYKRSVLEGCLFDLHLASLEDWDFLLSVLSRSRPRPFSGGGAVMHKDYVNPGNRRGTQEDSRNSIVVLDHLYIYRRWPAPSPELRIERQNLLTSMGMKLPVEWL